MPAPTSISHGPTNPAVPSNCRSAWTISCQVYSFSAGVSVQTVLRHFGSRDGLFEAAMTHGQQAVSDERRAPVGDVEEAVRILMDHYEQRGRGVLLLLAQEPVEPRVAQVTDEGRLLHRRWVQEVFEPFLPAGAA